MHAVPRSVVSFAAVFKVRMEPHHFATPQSPSDLEVLFDCRNSAGVVVVAVRSYQNVEVPGVTPAKIRDHHRFGGTETRAVCRASVEQQRVTASCDHH